MDHSRRDKLYFNSNRPFPDGDSLPGLSMYADTVGLITTLTTDRLGFSLFGGLGEDELWGAAWSTVPGRNRATSTTSVVSRDQHAIRRPLPGLLRRRERGVLDIQPSGRTGRRRHLDRAPRRRHMDRGRGPRTERQRAGRRTPFDPDDRRARAIRHEQPRRRVRR